MNKAKQTKKNNPVLNSSSDLDYEILEMISDNALESLTINYEFCVTADCVLDEFGEINYNSKDNPFWLANKIKKITRIDFPVLFTNNVHSLSKAFMNLDLLEHINIIDTSMITDMSETFSGASSFNQPIGDWNTSRVKNMSGMFNSALKFNQEIGKWDTSNVENMQDMFCRAKKFNKPLGCWNTSKVRNMSGMFRFASSFNQAVESWDTSNVITMFEMFSHAIKFNKSLDRWNTAKVTTTEGMFSSAKRFDEAIGNWKTSNVRNMSKMFCDAKMFNHDIGMWDTSNVESMSNMFDGAEKFNKPIGEWDTTNVTDMSYMFRGANNFNQNISTWNTSNVNQMQFMFFGAVSFNQPIGRWNTSNLNNIFEMFSGALAFNQDLSEWKIQKPGILSCFARFPPFNKGYCGVQSTLSTSNSLVFIIIETTGLNPDVDDVLRLIIIDANKNILYNSYFYPHSRISDIRTMIFNNNPIEKAEIIWEKCINGDEELDYYDNDWYSSIEFHGIYPGKTLGSPTFSEEIEELKKILKEKHVIATTGNFVFEFLGEVISVAKSLTSCIDIYSEYLSLAEDRLFEKKYSLEEAIEFAHPEFEFNRLDSENKCNALRLVWLFYAGDYGENDLTSISFYNNLIDNNIHFENHNESDDMPPNTYSNNSHIYDFEDFEPNNSTSTVKHAFNPFQIAKKLCIVKMIFRWFSNLKKRA